MVAVPAVPPAPALIPGKEPPGRGWDNKAEEAAPDEEEEEEEASRRPRAWARAS